MAVRLPLQTGASALRDTVATTVVASVLVWVGVAIMFAMFDGVFRMKTLSDLTGPPLISFCFACAALASWMGGIGSARMHRASDLELDADGFTIQGGRKHGLSFTFAELKPSDVTLDEAVSGSIRSYLGQTRYKRAVYIKAQGDVHLIAEAAEDDEEASVRALIDAIASRLAGAGLDDAARPDVVVVCATCGAPVQPVDAATAMCGHCQAAAPMPDEIRTRLRNAISARDAHAKLDRAVGRVLVQPGATRINVSLAVAGVVVSVAGLAAPVLLYFRPGIGAAMIALAVAAFFAARAQIGRRRALRDVTLGFAARTDKAGVSCCRVCNGALPHDELAVARCIYCNAMNVRGLDFGRRASTDAKVERELEVDLGVRARHAWVATALAAGSVALAVALALFVR